MRSKLEVADIFRRHGDTFRAAQGNRLSLDQRKVMAAIEVVAPGLLVVLFSPNGNAVSHLNAQLVRQLERSGAHVLVIGASDGTAGPNRLVLDLKVPDEYLAPLFEIVPLQLLSHALAVQRGIIPGTFVNTTPVVLTR